MTTTGSGITAGANIGVGVPYTAPTQGMLKKGMQKIVLDIPPVLDLAAWWLQNTIIGGTTWNNAVIPAVEKGFAARGVKLRLVRNSTFFLNAAGQTRATPAKGYQPHVRKGYDRSKRQFFLWLEVY